MKDFLLKARFCRLKIATESVPYVQHGDSGKVLVLVVNCVVGKWPSRSL